MRKNVNWILDADVRGFYDNLSHDDEVDAPLA
jgi:hypothetical protein